ncbi:feruloyl esterase [Mumia flava]|uniref:Feruloyl esterase n=1 Tax=Mumia flava TaxID=1348852 RepID=A0A2M9AR92_9ACTN|nr:tannase/feruloyl esterase family alpha/beta hydrolase [Mumia flava]PJJ48221.1 feruloyl esterase [Mumia flava]
MPWTFQRQERPSVRSTRRRPAFLAAAVGAAAILVLSLAQAGTVSAATSAGSHGRTAVTADGLRDLAALAPVMACEDVVGLDLDGVTDAPVTITAASVVDDGTTAPYCEVTGTVAPANTIMVRLPVEGWTQRYVQTGCGGLCGNVRINYGQSSGCPVIEDGSVASASTDMGHQGQNDGSWAADNPQAQIDFAYRGVHVTAEVAKALITRFYGQAPAYSYFTGCSDGGREALMEAQRYPDDFDGIAAGAPASNMAVQNTYHHAWNVLANQDEKGQFILLADKLPVVHDAVIAACDGIDGVEDGILDDPRACGFDPMTIVCADGQDPSTCLSTEEAEVVQKLHEGARTADGKRLEQEISHEWGSELEWTLFVPATPDGHAQSENFALSYLRYLADPNDADPDYELSDLPLTVKGFWDTVMPSSSYMAALDPDLKAYRKGGGKLLLWHGWNDQHISPQNTLAYYDAMQKTMGKGAVKQFAKLYLFPGMAHCGGGDGPNSTDVLTPVMAWVESGRAPDRLIASATDDQGTVTRTRPVYPYPTVARYDGTGSTDDAANFVAYTPKKDVGPDYRWVGESLLSHGYQTQCKAVGDDLVCKPLHPKGKAKKHGKGHPNDKGGHGRTGR